MKVFGRVLNLKILAYHEKRQRRALIEIAKQILHCSAFLSTLSAQTETQSVGVCVSVHVKAVQTFTLHTASAINNRKTIKFAISQMESGTRNGSEELLPAHVKCMRWPNKAQQQQHQQSTIKRNKNARRSSKVTLRACAPFAYPANIQHGSTSVGKFNI